MYEEVSYFSEELKIEAYLYRPKDWKVGGEPRPEMLEWFFKVMRYGHI